MKFPKKVSGKIRVAILADLPRDAVGGLAKGRGGGQTSTWLSQIADNFAQEDELDIWWITFDPGTKDIEQVFGANQWFLSLPMPNMKISLLIDHRWIASNFKRLLTEIQPDIIHCWATERAYPAALEAIRVPKILSMQGILTEYHRIGSLPRGWQWKKLAALEPRWMRAADVVTVESEWGINIVRQIVPDKELRMIEYGVHPSFYGLQWMPNTEKPYALFCGTIDWRKGVDLLADAVSRLPNRNWECHLAGDGNLREALERRNIPRFIFLGNLSWNKMQHELKHAACLVLPTRADTSPNVVKEARVVGLPIITSRHGGQSGYIFDEVNGLIVDPLEPEGLAAALNRVMLDLNLARRMGAQRHLADREYFRSERTARAFADLYRELAAR